MISDMILDNGEKVRVVLHAYLRDEDVLANKRKHKELLATHTEFIKKHDVRLDEEIASYVDDETADWDFTELIFGLFVPDAEESCAMMDAVICNIFLSTEKDDLYNPAYKAIIDAIANAKDEKSHFINCSFIVTDPISNMSSIGIRWKMFIDEQEVCESKYCKLDGDDFFDDIGGLSPLKFTQYTYLDSRTMHITYTNAEDRKKIIDDFTSKLDKAYHQLSIPEDTSLAMNILIYPDELYKSDPEFISNTYQYVNNYIKAKYPPNSLDGKTKDIRSLIAMEIEKCKFVRPNSKGHVIIFDFPSKGNLVVRVDDNIVGMYCG